MEGLAEGAMGGRPGCSAGADRWILMTSPGSDFTCVCLVTLLPPSSLVMGFASAGLKSSVWSKISIFMQSRRLSPFCRGEKPGRRLCVPLSAIWTLPWGALGSHGFWKASLVRRWRQGSGTSTGAGRASGGDSDVDHTVAVGVRRSG